MVCRAVHEGHERHEENHVFFIYEGHERHEEKILRKMVIDRLGLPMELWVISYVAASRASSQAAT